MRAKRNPVAYRLNSLMRCLAKHWEAGILPPDLDKVATAFFDYGRIRKIQQVAHLEAKGHTRAATEKRLILDTLARFGGNREDTARTLEIGTRTLYRKLAQWEAERKDGER